MSQTVKAACVQMNSGPHIPQNLDIVERLIREAAAQGATLIATPEVTDQVLSNRAEKLGETHTQEEHPGVARFSALAQELSVTLLIGSMCIRVSEEKVANRSFLFGDDGALKATYDKIHLYDVDLPTGESHRESKLFEGGSEAVLADLEGYKLGMTICYDLRFPHLHRDLAKKGAAVITIPAAFTVPTGQAHWEVLLRARAIETGCFILAPAQCGDHQGARKTYGHSMIIAPRGEVLGQAGTQEEGFVLADLDMALVGKARSAIPALRHDREYRLL